MLATFVMPWPCAGHPRLDGMSARKTWMAGHRRAEATPSFGRLCPAMTEKRAQLPQPFSREHLFEDLPLDAFVGEASIVPPPAIPLHLLGGGDEAVGDFGKIRIAVVQAEDHAP